MTTATGARLLVPTTLGLDAYDDATQRLFRATVDWFEAKGKARLTTETRSDGWYGDFVEFLASERAFAILLTPDRDGGGDPDKRWDTHRNALFNEILGFYGLPYWYAWQDIGNGNVSRMTSVFGRRADLDGPGGYVFFAADSAHPAYKVVKNVVHAQMYVSAFDLEDYPVSSDDVLHAGKEAFEAALNTINVGKFNLGFCSIGLAEHCFHETINQAEERVLFGKRVTEFGQIRRILSEAYARLLATKLYGARAVDYVRDASLEDRRYLLYTPINKMQVTTEGERIVRLLAEVISAKGFERDSYFDSAKAIVDGLPKLEGTVHVNRALLLKFLPAYLFGEAALEPPPARDDAGDDEFLFAQGPTRGLSAIAFPDWRPAFERAAAIPNVARFREQAESLLALLQQAPLTPAQMSADLDFQQSLAQLFTLVPYGQLILERTELDGTPSDIVDLIFETLVRDFSTTAIELHGKASSTAEQQAWALGAVRKPVVDERRAERIYGEIRGLAGAYEMTA